MKVRLLVSASGIVEVDVDEKTAEQLKNGDVLDLADIDPDWDDVIESLTFDVDDVV